MPELIGSFLGLESYLPYSASRSFWVTTLSLKKIHVFNGELKVRSVICYGVGGLQIPRFDRSNLFIRWIANHKWLIDFLTFITT